jgi:hypothetical protein
MVMADPVLQRWNCCQQTTKVVVSTAALLAEKK